MRIPIYWLKTVLLAVLLGLGQAAFADVRMPKIFSDGMVLQRDRQVPVWGWEPDGEKVTVEFSDQLKSAVVKDGKWRIDLDAMPASATEQVMTVKGSNTLPQPVQRVPRFRETHGLTSC